MSNPPYGGMPPAAAPWPPQGPPPGRGPSRLPLILTAAVAVIAIAVAIASWFRPMPEPEAQASEPQFSKQEIADAKDAVCEAHDRAAQAVRTAGRLASDDPTKPFPIAVNTRLAFQSAGDYLIETLRDNSAAPPDIAEEAQKLAAAYRYTAISLLRNANDSEFTKSDAQLNSSDAKFLELCK